MFTRKRWTPPNIPPSLSPDVQQYLRDLNKSVSDYLLSLEAKGSLTINEAEITASQGIKFPATQVASSDANTLDDYEEGSWTPSDTSGASLSFTTPVGVYTKVGNLVFASGRLRYPVTADGSTAKIGGLPFTVKNSDGARGGGMISFSDEATATSVIATANSTEMQIVAGAGVLTNATMSNDQIYFSVIYQI